MSEGSGSIPTAAFALCTTCGLPLGSTRLVSIDGTKHVHPECSTNPAIRDQSPTATDLEKRVEALEEEIKFFKSWLEPITKPRVYGSEAQPALTAEDIDRLREIAETAQLRLNNQQFMEVRHAGDAIRTAKAAFAEIVEILPAKAEQSP